MSVSTHPSSQTDLTLLNTAKPRYEAESGETYMNTRQKLHLKEVLKAERAYWVDIQNRLISEFLQKKSGRLSSDPADIANREIEVRSAVRGREQRLIKKIDEALSRLSSENSQYGFCSTCRAEIGIQRLEVRPTATLCFDCKTLDEIREKQTGKA